MSQPDIRLIARGLREHYEIETREIRGGIGNPLVRDGLLVRSHLVDTWEDGEMGGPVLSFGDGLYGYADGAGIHPLAWEDIQLWRSDFRAVGERIARTLDCEDQATELIPAKLLRLGPAETPIGRRAFRTIYFASEIRDQHDPVFGKIVEKEDYILIAGFADNVIFPESCARRTFVLEDVMASDSEGKWQIRKDVLDSRFTTPTQPKERKPNAAKQKRLFEIAERLQELCFQHRHKWDELQALREKMKTQKGVGEAVGIRSTTTINEYLGNGARCKNENPLAFFWWDTLMNRDGKFQVFEQFLDQDHVRTQIPKYQAMKPDALKDLVEKFLTAKTMNMKMRKTR